MVHFWLTITSCCLILLSKPNLRVGHMCIILSQEQYICGVNLTVLHPISFLIQLRSQGFPPSIRVMTDIITIYLWGMQTEQTKHSISMVLKSIIRLFYQYG